MRRVQQYSDQINMYYSRLVIQVLFSTLLATANLANADTKRAGHWEGTLQVGDGSDPQYDMWRIEIGRIF